MKKVTWFILGAISIAAVQAQSSPSNLSYPRDTLAYSDAIYGPEVPRVTGTVTHWSVAPPFHAAIKLDSLTGIISGNPLTLFPLTAYTITASNSSGSTTTVVWIGSFPGLAIQSGSVDGEFLGAWRGHKFVLNPATIASTEAMSMTIMDLRGRVVWSRAVYPSRDGVREISWEPRVSGTFYFARVSVSNSGGSTRYVSRIF